MDITLVVVLALVVFVVLLLTGRSQLARGANTATANGATLLALATVMGVAALALVASLDVW